MCDMIARDFGEPRLMAMLKAYRAGLNSEQVVRRVAQDGSAQRSTSGSTRTSACDSRRD